MTNLTFAEALAAVPETVESIKETTHSIEGIERFTNLLNLDISGNTTVKTFAFLKDFPGLVDLNLENLDLPKIPEEVFGLTNLKVLGLRNNRITDLTSVKTLTNLESLFAGGNRVKTIPKEFTKLKNLRQLDLSSNWITRPNRFYDNFQFAIFKRC